MRGLLKIAFKLLVNDRGKFFALLVGITFSVFLMVMMTSVFAGILRKASATVSNTGVRIWVMDPSVNNVLSSIPMPETVLSSVRSIPGVRYAVPLYSGAGLAHLADGMYQPVTIVGLDDTSLLGHPQMLQGNILDIYADDSVIAIVDSEYPKLQNPKLGTTFEINDRRAKVVGLAQVPESGLFGLPTLYTTYRRAIEYVPSGRYTISYVLIEPASAAEIPGIKDGVRALGFVARTDDEFRALIADFYKFHTGLGTNILLMTVISFLVGLSVSGQTFYAFVLENLERFGALKAIGAKGRDLVYMIFFQVGMTSLAGYGLGIGLVSVLIAGAKARIPEYASVITFGNLGLAFLMVLVIAVVSSYLAVRRVLRIEPFEIFRA